MLKLTGAILMAICPTLDKARAQQLAELHNEICPRYGIDRPGRLHEFVAQCAHESGEFRTKVENLNYSAARLQQVFRYFAQRPAEALKVQRNPEAIANLVYADANRPAAARLGNRQPGDGWRFRGGGFIQITGGDMYRKYAAYLKGEVYQVAEQVRTDDRWALDSACWVFAIEKELLDEADRDQFELITRRINGGINGLEDRVKYYERAKRYII